MRGFLLYPRGRTRIFVRVGVSLTEEASFTNLKSLKKYDWLLFCFLTNNWIVACEF